MLNNSHSLRTATRWATGSSIHLERSMFTATWQKRSKTAKKHVAGRAISAVCFKATLRAVDVTTRDGTRWFFSGCSTSWSDTCWAKWSPRSWGVVGCFLTASLENLCVANGKLILTDDLTLAGKDWRGSRNLFGTLWRWRRFAHLSDRWDSWFFGPGAAWNP